MLKISDYLEPVMPRLSPALIPLRHRAPILAAASCFPEGLSRCFDLEFRLGETQPATDFLFCVTHRERGQLLAPGAFDALAPQILDLPLWQRILRFVEAWNDPSGALYHKVLMVWFEFDLDGDAGAGRASLAAPGFFFGSRDFPHPGSAAPGAHDWLYETALPLLAGASLPPEVEDSLRRVSACLPPGAGIYQIGLFPSRRSPHLRACLTGIRPQDIVPYLRRVGYPASLSPLEALTGEMAALGELHLDIDISDEGIGPKVGLECSQKRDSLSLIDGKEAPLFDWLARKGLCSAEQQSALMELAGIERLATPAEASAEAAPSSDHPTLPALARELSHVKVVYLPGQPLQAKAYVQINRTRLDALGLAANQLAFAARQKSIRQSLEQLRQSAAPARVEG